MIQSISIVSRAKWETTMTGIYLLTNLVNGKKYVGQSTDINRRFAEHLRAAQPDRYPQKSERDANCPIHKAMAKYGINNFSLTILEDCVRKELDEKERKWIAKLNTNNNLIGYNLTVGGQKTFALKVLSIYQFGTILKNNGLSHVSTIPKV